MNKPGIKNSNHEPIELKLYSAISTGLIPFLWLCKPLLAMYGGFRDTVPERLGRFSPALDELEGLRNGRKLVWIHAVSVGEVSVAQVLVDAIKFRKPDVMIAVSTTTFTGRDYINKNFKPDALFFFPLDLPSVMRRLVDKIRPDCFLDIEVELWPNLFRALSRKEIPMVLANGRMSDRAASPPAIYLPVLSWSLKSFDALFMRSREDVERAVSLGALPDKTHLAGNLKFAACGQPPSAEKRNETRNIFKLARNGKLFVAGSTHPGEEEILVDAWKKLGGDVTLVLAPRHLEQVDRIMGLLRSSGENGQLWTDVRDKGIGENTRAVVVNTIGELMRLYGAADVAFVGGSLIKRGGHNVLEPVAMGVPTIHGPSMENFHDLKKALNEKDLLVQVKDVDEIVHAVKRIISGVDRDEYQKAARELIAGQLNAADMIADYVVSVL